VSKRKRRRHKRLFPVKMASDYINVTQRPRNLIISDKDPEGDKWFDNNARVKTVIGPKSDKEPLTENTFVEKKKVKVREIETRYGKTFYVDRIRLKPVEREIPETKGRLLHSYFDKEKNAIVHADATPKMEVQQLERLWASKLGAGHGIDRFNFMVHSEFRGRVLKLGFSGELWVWLEETPTQMRRSAFYGGRVKAERALRENRVYWEVPWKLKKQS
jgi:hypothetical protein